MTYAVLAQTAVTSAATSTLIGDLGIASGTAPTGFPPGTVSGTTHLGDAASVQAESDLETAYLNATNVSRTSTLLSSGELGGLTFTPGVYSAGSFAALSIATGNLTLNGQNNPNSVFIFQMSTTLTVGTGIQVQLTNGAQACNVFWAVGTGSTIAANAIVDGSIMAQTAITIAAGATINGRALSHTTAVTLSGNTVTVPGP